MNIDFHHGVTYIAARLAGFSESDAEIVAHSAQYVDDAINTGEIRFDNGMMYARIASAHRMLDYHNARALDSHRVWLPFHFLPGNGGLDAECSTPAGSELDFAKRAMCRADSPLARDMLRGTILRRDRPHALHRLGIALHVYADTWAHQGFVGFMSVINQARDLASEMPLPRRRLSKLALDLWARARDAAIGLFVGEIFPVGHGAVLGYPDQPYLRWSYTNGLGERIERDNPRDFGAAARQMFVAMVRFRAGDPDCAVAIPEEHFHRVDRWLAEIKDADADVRHARWLELIRSGEFGFKDEVGYVGKGARSWKHEALETAREIDLVGETFHFRPQFLNSDWKLFHDALQVHRLFVLNELLPAYGLCAA